MATNEGVSPFPLPPTQYSRLYTDENVEQGKTPDPPPPIEGSYSMFGASFETDESIIRPLEVQGIPRLYPQNRRLDRITELKKLNHSILVNFLELLDILIQMPSSDKREAKLEDLRLLFINMHHIINELRPHQARETLRVMMERQKRQRLDTADKLQKHITRVMALLQNTSGSLQLALSQDEEMKESKVGTSSIDTSDDASGSDWKDDFLNAAVENVS